MEYLGGLLDGEGYASICRIPRPGGYEYCLRIAIYNSDHGVLREIRRTWGGHLSYVPARHAGWKPSFALIWTNAAAARFLVEVGPHLQVKVRQARLMVQFHRIIQDSRRRRDSRGRLLPLSTYERKVREGYYRLLKSLNRRGRKARLEQRAVRVRSLEVQRLRPISPDYLAGFIDGEGSLMLAKVPRKKGPRYGYVPRLCIDNTNKEILERIRGRYGGNIFQSHRREAGWKDLYTLVWTGRNVEPVLRVVAPHLSIKRSRAVIVLRFIEHLRRTQQTTFERDAQVSGRTMAFRQALYQQMRELNAKGPSSRFHRVGTTDEPHGTKLRPDASKRPVASDGAESRSLDSVPPVPRAT